MNAHPNWVTEMRGLLDGLQDGIFDESDALRLNELLRAGASQRDFYITYMDIHSRLAWDGGRGKDEGQGAKGKEFEFIDAAEVPPAPLPLSTTHYPLPTNFIGGPVFSYMVATVLLCLMLLGAWAYKVSHIQPSDPGIANSNNPPSPVFVGQITGMKDCRWADPDTQTVVGASVALNRRYAIASGLIEITYNNGATVILEGMCTYKVDSTAGGYLELGKLTARIEHQGPTASAAGAKPQAMFSVKTPTAVVTDLGTEFGVEVDENGDTTSHVFQGSVKVQLAAGGAQETLRAGESITASRVRETHRDSTTAGLVRFTHPTTTPNFVRRIYETPKILDLLDIVAGGDGSGRRRERGIDPSSGWEDPMFVTNYRGGDRQYYPVLWHRLIDGVFVPDGGTGEVQLDSAGNTFKDFPATDGRVYGSIWSRAADVGEKSDKITISWTYTMTNADQFMPNRRGLLVFYANTGITFDIGAIRETHLKTRPTRFKAIVGLADGPHRNPDAKQHGLGLIDLWVFVDGQLKLKREQLRARDGTVDVDVELGPSDRFLTLVTTDGGDGIGWDCVVVGEPVLEMTEIEIKQ